ncbi:MAG: SurA N-terminal domain-containing protein [Nitrospirae bacterium]|nr:SurA N-terminal domain-containing protein [Nitrospirota bacterium]
MKLPCITANIQFPKNRMGCARRLVAGIGLSLCILMLSSAVRAELVDRIVAAVNTEVITASDLAQAVALNMRLGGTHEDRKTLESDTLEGLITRRLLVQEARRLRFVEVSDDDIKAENDKLRKLFSSDKDFADFLAEQNMTEQELGRMLGERLLVERFVGKKVGLFVRVSREEAQRYFEEHTAEYKDKRFQDIQKTIVALLTDRKIEKQLNQYVAELRSKADLRIYTR